MPLPAELHKRLDTPEFWRAYLFQADVVDDEDDWDDDDLDEDEAEAGSIVVEIPVGRGYALVLDIDGELDMVDLGMRTPGSAEILEIGWDDQAHWHPDTLRWAELDLIARAAAVADPTLRHPGPVLALAGRFVILGPGDDLDAITPLMDAAFGPPPPGAGFWPRTRDWLHRADGRPHGIVWRPDAAGDWAVDQAETANVTRDLYSVRRPGSAFPFAAWRELLTAAEETLAAGPLPTPENDTERAWVDETTTGAPRGSLIAARFGPSPLRASRRFDLALDLPDTGRRHSYAAEVCADLNRTLREADRGTAMVTGGTSGGRQTSTLIDIGVVDDLDAGIALVREVLSRHAPDPATRLTDRRHGPIPLL
ncbi:hypothetical protein AB0G04_11720 [Actinoplanes sp. NPDC023801]|uniref:hypothetical protein n=1 Tax=Actinoplanes sp. NPDC023801 TaxID=3154595 RepID=UPI0034014F47